MHYELGGMFPIGGMFLIVTVGLGTCPQILIENTTKNGDMF